MKIKIESNIIEVISAFLLKETKEVILIELNFKQKYAQFDGWIDSYDGSDAHESVTVYFCANDITKGILHPSMEGTSVEIMLEGSWKRATYCLVMMQGEYAIVCLIPKPNRNNIVPVEF